MFLNDFDDLFLSVNQHTSSFISVLSVTIASSHIFMIQSFDSSLYF